MPHEKAFCKKVGSLGLLIVLGGTVAPRVSAQVPKEPVSHLGCPRVLPAGALHQQLERPFGAGPRAAAEPNGLAVAPRAKRELDLAHGGAHRPALRDGGQPPDLTAAAPGEREREPGHGGRSRPKPRAARLDRQRRRRRRSDATFRLEKPRSPRHRLGPARRRAGHAGERKSMAGDDSAGLPGRPRSGRPAPRHHQPRKRRGDGDRGLGQRADRERPRR